MPLNKKVEAINSLAPSTNHTEVHKFIGLINYYCDMWKERSEILAPLTKLTSTETPWKWTDKQQNAFDTTKKIVARETILAYPDFKIPFEVHTDASPYQLGAVISQNGKPIAFYSRKLIPTQTWYTTTEWELLSIVKTLKEFRTILLVQQLIVHTDHENLTYKHFNSESPLGILNSPMNEAHFTEALCSELYAFDDEDLPATAFPLSNAFLGKAQSTDVAILKETAKTNHFTLSNPSQGKERHEKSFATMVKLWSQRNYKQ
jgi:hypothetical protein